MRLTVSALLAANLVVLAWWQGWLSPLVEPPSARDREPYREARQIRPEAIRVGALLPLSGPPAAASAAGTTEARGEEGTAGDAGVGTSKRR